MFSFSEMSFSGSKKWKSYWVVSGFFFFSEWVDMGAKNKKKLSGFQNVKVHKTRNLFVWKVFFRLKPFKVYFVTKASFRNSKWTLESVHYIGHQNIHMEGGRGDFCSVS
jgi:hypothetical protein